MFLYDVAIITWKGLEHGYLRNTFHILMPKKEYEKWEKIMLERKKI